MAQYLTYDEYVQYGGTIPEQDFALAEYKAQSRIDYLTDCRVQKMATVPEAVKMAVMAIMSYNAKFSSDAQLANPAVASYSTDGYSETYGSAAEQTASANKALTSEIGQMLYGVKDDYGVPLLYRGLVVSGQPQPVPVRSEEYVELQNQMNALQADVENDMDDLRGDVSTNYLRIGR